MFSSLSHHFLLLAAATLIAISGAQNSPLIVNQTYTNFVSEGSTSYAIYHIESDKYIPGNVLYSHQCSLQTSSGFGSSASNVVGHIYSCGYTNSYGTSARLYYIFGFTQLNNTHVVLADYYNHCLRLVNRQTRYTSTFAGYCTSSGFSDGSSSSARFTYPHSITIDPTKPTQLVVSDQNNNALRVIDILTQVVSTLIRSGLSYPEQMTWNSDQTTLYIRTSSSISAVDWSTKNITVFNGGSSSASSQFNSAVSSSSVDDISGAGAHGVLMVKHDSTITFLDFQEQTATPICQSSSDCSFTSLYYSVFLNGSNIYAGRPGYIDRMSGVDQCELTKRACPVNGFCVNTDNGTRCQCYVGYSGDNCEVECESYPNKTIYLTEGKTTTRHQIGNDIAVLSEGSHEFIHKYDALDCSYLVNVEKTPITRQLNIKGQYDVQCHCLNSSFNQAFLRATISQINKEFDEDICQDNCDMTHQSQFTCADETLNVQWPINLKYPVDIIDIPSVIGQKLGQRLANQSSAYGQLMILTNQPLMVSPKVGSDGLRLRLSFVSSCVDETKSYDADTDSCN